METKRTPIGKKPRGGQVGNKNGLRHGLYSYKAMLEGDCIDKRTSLYQAMKLKEQEFGAALGGDPSPQEMLLVADTVKVMIYVSSLDAYLFKLRSLVRKGRPHPVLDMRTKLAAHLRENVRALGLKRVPVDVQDLAQLLEESC